MVVEMERLDTLMMLLKMKEQEVSLILSNRSCPITICTIMKPFLSHQVVSLEDNNSSICTTQEPEPQVATSLATTIITIKLTAQECQVCKAAVG